MPTTQGFSTFGTSAPLGYGRAGAAVAPPTAANGIPEWVVVSCTLLGLYAVVAFFVAAALAVLGTSLQSDTSSVDVGSFATGMLASAAFWLLCAAVDVALVVALRTGNQLGRLGASLVGGLWALYWLNQLRKLFGATAAASAAGAGSVIGLVELLMFVLALLAAIPAVLPWLRGSTRHFG